MPFLSEYYFNQPQRNLVMTTVLWLLLPNFSSFRASKLIKGDTPMWHKRIRLCWAIDTLNWFHVPVGPAFYRFLDFALHTMNSPVQLPNML